ncbi:MAG: hypothetical protein ABI837_01790 [Acidobacteriota bacterium]
MPALIHKIVQDMEAGRENWRVVTFFSSAALGIPALYFWVVN